MNEKLVALSIESKNISGAIGTEINGEFEIVDTITKVSNGISKCKVVDKKLLTESILDVLEELSHRNSERIDSVYLSIGTEHTNVKCNKGVFLLDNAQSVVSKKEVLSAYMDGQSITKDSGEYIFDSIIRNIYLDGQMVLDSPIEKNALSIEIDLDIIATEKEYLNDIQDIFNSIGCKINGFILGLNALKDLFSADNINSGPELFIDFGDEKTDFIYYENNRINDMKSIELGGVNIIKDLSFITKFDEEVLDTIKTEYAPKYDTLRREFSKITHNDVNIDSVLFYDVINARIEEILSYIRKYAEEKNIYDGMTKVTVFGDSICLFENIEVLIEEVLQKKTKVFTKNDIKVENSSIITSIAIVKEVYDRLKLIGKDIIIYIPEEVKDIIVEEDKISNEDVKEVKKKGLSKVLRFLGDIF
ncbi:cell division FtsA domain-containing protein [uncultured Clostridium sp.]|uniref:cell division FtsA domain-containing protein n=1 Tax=uncultured Clostridium sp. TaxID=59620 RepID=UPI00260D67B0|nr:cell division FtsA domain-containing protein [uncultured Clostridium sp.]